MVATEDGYAAWEADFESDEQGDGLDRVVSTVDVVTYIGARQLENGWPYIVMEEDGVYGVIPMNRYEVLGQLPPIRNSSIKSWNWPWISPQTVTGQRYRRAEMLDIGSDSKASWEYTYHRLHVGLFL